MARVKAVIFDCDGVMFDSRAANIKFYNHILAHFGKRPMTSAEVDHVQVHTADESIKHLFRDDPNLARARAFRLKMDYRPFISDMVMEDGLLELLRFLKPRVKTAISTNRSNTIEAVLAEKGLQGYFDLVVSAQDVRSPKPDPESLELILTSLALRPEEALYIGDSEVDRLTSERAGVPFVAYKNRELKANHFIGHLLELTALVGKD